MPWTSAAPIKLVLRSEPRGAETMEEITANATAADVILEQAQLDALTALQVGGDDS